MRKFACLLGWGMVLLLGRTAAAQDTPKMDASLGYSYLRTAPDT